MTMRNSQSTIFFIWVSLLVTPAIGRAELSCDDFLSKLSKKPRNIEFLGCKSNKMLQGNPLEASYKVSGARAAAAEKYLIKEFKVKKLRRDCCVWESAANFYRDKNGMGYVIDMATEETTLNKRSRWNKIPYFYIKVRAYNEDP